LYDLRKHVREEKVNNNNKKNPTTIATTTLLSPSITTRLTKIMAKIKQDLEK